MREKELDRIKKYISGKANRSEKLWVEEKFAGGDMDPQLRDLLKEDWDHFEVGEERDLSHILGRIYHTIHTADAVKHRTFIYRLQQAYVKIAALLLIPLLVAGIYYYRLRGDKILKLEHQETTATVMAPLGSRVAFTLPDGTTGFLNSGSSVLYATPFTNRRKVTLKGEAWFEVAKDAKHPFEISAGDATIRVLGTSFNVSAYPGDDYIEVVLQEGSVAFKPDPASKTVTIKPNERLVYINHAISIANTDPCIYNGWTQGKLIFRDDSMEDVARRIERWYNVKVEIGSENLRDYVFRGTFIDDPLDEVLRLLSMTSPIDYKITPRHLLEDGTWEKQKITLMKKNRMAN